MMQSKAFVAAVGALIAAGIALLAHLFSWSPEVAASVLGLAGAALAVWRTGVAAESTTTQDGDDKGFVRVDVLASVLIGVLSLGVFVVLLSLMTGCDTLRTLHKNNPTSVTFDVNRKTCAMWVDVDGERVFVINPGPSTKSCDVRVEP